MAKERTLSIIKPDAVRKDYVGEIMQRLGQKKLRPIAMRMMQLTKEEAAAFYAVHKQRFFYEDLIAFMSSGPILAMVLEGDNAVAVHREIMGATDPRAAAAGTIRADFATTIDENAIHGSDSLDNAATEIAFFFATYELCQRHPF